ncbi:MAG: shikimate dehydrogenase [Crocinitomicaceae bacterium]|mgnify:CR=1 FL=1|nr:shikimate dehydrogenase [Crocinitomicaceae bacterium]|tara:strand:+ start:204 stop:1250 length:1047 start_codon:yes stop_codon:yes gene_type:complete
MKNNSTYIIGEIGQNHNGSLDIAKELIDMANMSIVEPVFNTKVKKIDAVKFTKRDLSEELSNSQMNKPYNSPHSFGKTYGEHRKYLELNDQEHFQCYKYAKEKNLDFIETLCSIKCLSILNLFNPDFLKVASRDLTNIPLIEALSETKIPIILSTGMAGEKELDEALNTILKNHAEISILHCVSEYPTRPENVNLKSINYLLKNYSNYKVGYSDHTIGISAAVAAVAMGASIIEKHITLDRKMKGTDHLGSLGPDGLKRLIRDIRILEKSLGKESIFISPTTKQARIKLERSIASNKELKKGHTISKDDIHLLSPGDGVKWNEKNLIIGKKVKNQINKDEIIYLDNII